MAFKFFTGVILLSLVTFWISPLRNEKLAIHCISLFLLSVFILKLEDILPATPDKLPYLSKYNNFYFVCIITVNYFIKTIYLQ